MLKDLKYYWLPTIGYMMLIFLCLYVCGRREKWTRLFKYWGLLKSKATRTQMNYTDQCSGSQMFLAPEAHPTHMQSAFKVDFIEGNVSDPLMPNQAFLLKHTFISDLNQGPTFYVEVIEVDVCIMFCLLAVRAKASGGSVARKEK